MKTFRYLPLFLFGVASAFADDSEGPAQPQRPPQFPEPAPKPEEKGNVTLGGQVRRPGSFQFRPGMTLADALSAGGGITEFGNAARVKLTRDGKEKVIDSSKKESKAFPLQPGDCLEVPQLTILGK